jgi:NAD(P)-dependent dehydrogenase (short-subunit alcohol dehydrogenase family)
VGLGTGSLAVYGRKGDYLRIYEINPAVEKLSGPNGSIFTFVRKCPGTVDVPMHQGANLAGKQPTGRLIPLEDVAAMLLFLCGPSSSDINGSILPIDAGWSAG